MEDIGKKFPEKCFTPPNLEDIFIRTCENILDNAGQCSFAWTAFTLAFRLKDPTTVTKEDYRLFFDILPVESPRYSAVFWSGVPGIIEQISVHPKVSTSANRVSSSIINNMAADNNVMCWCGNVTTHFDTLNPCPITPVVEFWKAFSSRFGESGNGIVYWIGDGNRKEGAYQNTTLFTEFEFPRIKYPKVYKLVAIVIYDCDERGNETMSEGCGEGTLKELENQAMARFGSYRCEKVCGNVSDERQISSLSEKCLQIITDEQQKGIATYVRS